jgi:hypothetical protein
MFMSQFMQSTLCSFLVLRHLGSQCFHNSASVSQDQYAACVCKRVEKCSVIRVSNITMFLHPPFCLYSNSDTWLLFPPSINPKDTWVTLPISRNQDCTPREKIQSHNNQGKITCIILAQFKTGLLQMVPT